MPSRTSLRTSLSLITWGGCLFMVFNTGVSSPLITKFLERLGASPTQIGLYAGIPMLALSMQFAGALYARRLRHRKPTFMACMIIGRLLYLPVLLLPAFVPSLQNPTGVSWMLFFLFAANLLNHMATPLWFSWIGDLIPGRVLHRYWGVRQTWCSGVWVVSYLLIMSVSRIESIPFYPLVVGVGCVSVLIGVVDILLIGRVHEPAFTQERIDSPLRLLLLPLLDRHYRHLVAFFGAWSAAASCAAALMGFYLFVGLKMSVWQATLLWGLQGLGTAVSAQGWGRIAQRRGCVFVLRISMLFKILIAVGFLIATPDNAFPLLTTILFFDGMWNAGYGVAQNGLMLSHSPDNNRPVFVASMIGFCGLFSAISSILGGRAVDMLSGRELEVAGWQPNPYQVVFFVSMLLRMGMAVWVWRLPPDKNSPTDPWISDLMLVWPFRVLRYPVGLYGRMRRERD